MKSSYRSYLALRASGAFRRLCALTLTLILAGTPATGPLAAALCADQAFSSIPSCCAAPDGCVKLDQPSCCSVNPASENTNGNTLPLIRAEAFQYPTLISTCETVAWSNPPVFRLASSLHTHPNRAPARLLPLLCVYLI
jgi:hypothetical protein